MTKWSQQMPLVYELTSIQSLTTADIDYIKARIAADNILDVVFVESSGEKLIPVAYTNPAEGTPTVTVIKNGNAVKASIEPTVVKLGLIMPSAAIGDNGDTYNAYLGALYSDGEVKLLIDKTTATNAFKGSTTKATGAWGDPSFVIAPSPATTATKIARAAFTEADVAALEKLAGVETVTATKCTINGFASPVAIKVGDTTPATVDLDDADVLYEYTSAPS